jgi:FPC/CPF motif-containing protein YcgG
MKTLSAVHDKNEVHLSEWVVKAKEQLVTTITQKCPLFPCFFAPSALTNRTLYYSFIEQKELAQPYRALKDLQELVSLEMNPKSYAALVLFVDTGSHDMSLKGYEQCFWNLLQFIHDHDPEKWPEEIPKNPDDLGWKFCFAGVPLFINAHSSAYKERRTRWAPCDLMLIIQQFANIDHLALHCKDPKSISERIRSYVQIYDGKPISCSFGHHFADPQVHNWKQFWLSEDDAEIDPRAICPLRI